MNATESNHGGMSGLPELERHALVSADLAWVETPGSAADKTEAAIRAYLWAVEIAERTGFGPSLNDWRHAARQAAQRPTPAPTEES